MANHVLNVGYRWRAGYPEEFHQSITYSPCRRAAATSAATFALSAIDAMPRKAIVEMPNRLLRDGICTSDPINALTPEEEVFFYRLLVVCDDFGHADARVAILKANCFPLRESASNSKIEHWLEGLARNGLIRRYLANGKSYLAVARWEQRIRTHPKHPLPTDDGSEWVDSNPLQLAATCGQEAAESGLGKGKGKGKGATSRTSRELRLLPDDWVPAKQTAEDLGREFGLRVPEDVERYVAAFRDACKAKGYVYRDFEAAFRNCVRQDWPKLRGSNGKVAPVPSDRKVVAL